MERNKREHGRRAEEKKEEPRKGHHVCLFLVKAAVLLLRQGNQLWLSEEPDLHRTSGVVWLRNVRAVHDGASSRQHVLHRLHNKRAGRSGEDEKKGAPAERDTGVGTDILPNEAARDAWKRPRADGCRMERRNEKSRQSKKSVRDRKGKSTSRRPSTPILPMLCRR